MYGDDWRYEEESWRDAYEDKAREAFAEQLENWDRERVAKERFTSWVSTTRGLDSLDTFNPTDWMNDEQLAALAKTEADSNPGAQGEAGGGPSEEG